MSFLQGVTALQSAIPRCKHRWVTKTQEEGRGRAMLESHCLTLLTLQCLRKPKTTWLGTDNSAFNLSPWLALAGTKLEKTRKRMLGAGKGNYGRIKEASGFESLNESPRVTYKWYDMYWLPVLCVILRYMQKVYEPALFFPDSLPIPSLPSTPSPLNTWSTLHLGHPVLFFQIVVSVFLFWHVLPVCPVVAYTLQYPHNKRRVTAYCI